MVGLSEKAKGKQRAIEPEEEDEAPVLQVVIRFTEGIEDLRLSLAPADSVRALKQKIREARPTTQQRRLRLIHSGRILADNLVLNDWLLNSEDRRRQRARVESKVRSGESTSSTSNVGSETVWLHCSVGAEFSGSEKEEQGVQQAQLRPLRGFDRLIAAGFSEDDIANFRRTFHSQSSENYLDSEPLGDDEDYDEHARELEERWIESLDGGTSTVSRSSPVPTTILQGVLVGFFFPLIPFFFFREPRAAVFWESGRPHENGSSVIFSKRMQLAVVLGLVLNLTFGAWRFILGK